MPVLAGAAGDIFCRVACDERAGLYFDNNPCAMVRFCALADFCSVIFFWRPVRGLALSLPLVPDGMAEIDLCPVRKSACADRIDKLSD
jgi:hypothetical protein